MVIPARIGSTRLPGKVLRNLMGAPMIAHVYRRALESGAEEVVIATDDAAVAEVAAALGARVCMTDGHHASGTDRINEVAGDCDWADEEIVVNLQGDEPCMPGSLLSQVAEILDMYPQADIATLCHQIQDFEGWQNPNLVKVVMDNEGRALYFSRAPIPYHRDQPAGLPGMPVYGHLGIYAYRVGALRRFSSLPASDLERSEALEQLRAMENGMHIQVAVARETPGPGVDTETDLLAAEKILQARYSSSS